MDAINQAAVIASLARGNSEALPAILDEVDSHVRQDILSNLAQPSIDSMTENNFPDQDIDYLKQLVDLGYPLDPASIDVEKLQGKLAYRFKPEQRSTAGKDPEKAAQAIVQLHEMGVTLSVPKMVDEGYRLLEINATNLGSDVLLAADITGHAIDYDHVQTLALNRFHQRKERSGGQIKAPLKFFRPMGKLTLEGNMDADIEQLVQEHGIPTIIPNISHYSRELAGYTVGLDLEPASSFEHAVISHENPGEDGVRLLKALHKTKKYTPDIDNLSELAQMYVIQAKSDDRNLSYLLELCAFAKEIETPLKVSSATVEQAVYAANRQDLIPSLVELDLATPRKLQGYAASLMRTALTSSPTQQLGRALDAYELLQTQFGWDCQDALIKHGMTFAQEGKVSPSFSVFSFVKRVYGRDAPPGINALLNHRS